MNFSELVDIVGYTLDGAGVLVIVIGVVAATVSFFGKTRSDPERAYSDYRVGLSKGILLGLEFLIAGDIIRTVAATPTFRNVGILGMIVLIRSFLSVTLTWEIQGHLPWRGKPGEQP